MIFACVYAGAAFGLFLVLSWLHSLHMFQLNSYKPATHLRWLGKNRTALVPGLAVALGADVACFLPPVWGAAVLGTAALVCAWFIWPRKAKKPLVYTARVRRMLGTLVLLGALGTALGFVWGQWFPLAALGALLAPLWVPAANLINRPLEKAVQRWFIRDAQRILRESPGLKIIGVTGSYGKTSVKYILKTLLEARYNVLMTPESYNTPMGVVLTVRNFLRPTHEIFVCEMGARHVGDIRELCDLVHPQAGVITSVGPQHLETFHTLENIQKTKFELADALPQGGLLLVNGEDANIRAHRQVNTTPALTYGLREGCDYYASDISASSRGTTFTVHTPDGQQETFTAGLLGAHNVINLLGGIALCCQLGIPLRALKPQVRRLEPVPHRLQMLPKGGGVTVIDDAYNANPSGAKAALDALALFDAFRVLVTPGMVELGPRQEELNRVFGTQAATVCDYAVLVGRRQAEPIKAGLLEAGFPEHKIYVADTLQDAVARAYGVDAGGREKVILLENDLPDNF